MPLLASAVNGFSKRDFNTQRDHLCLSIFNQARAPIFYEKWGVSDTLEGRFDCASLHMALLLRHLKGPLAQAVFDGFFIYTELTLREVGVSDLRVGKQVKQCAKFFYGALKAYNKALDNQTGLEEALTRNLYGNTPPSSLKDIVSYVKTCDQLLKTQDFKKVIPLEWPHLDKNEG